MTGGIRSRSANFGGTMPPGRRRLLRLLATDADPEFRCPRGHGGVTVCRLLGLPAARYPDVSVPKYNYTQPYL